MGRPAHRHPAGVVEVFYPHGLVRVVAAVLVADEQHPRRHPRLREGRHVLCRCTRDVVNVQLHSDSHDSLPPLKNMIGLFLLVAIAGFILLKKPTAIQKNTDFLPDNISSKLDNLWRAAQEALIDRKYLRAEKILLTILQFDERNAMAYNRLGIIYAGQKKYKDAIECFEIAQSLESSPSSLHNVGLIYLETKDYNKAAMAFEQALKIEDSLSTRHIAYAKALENLGKLKAAAKSLEKAVELDERPQTLRSLGALYLKIGDTEKAKELKNKLDEIKGDRQKISQKRLENNSSVSRKIGM